ncbi:ferritin-like metal-binding protein YciE [Mucilaginibacter sp. UYP25]|uniref:DUF892 family protein n=1 Tax=unclassified Mucilaginibacter TaxID=2617802 RepID=UPI003397206F
MKITYPNSLGTSAIRTIFINQLSILYAAKHHLIKSIPTLISHANFGVLVLALSEELDDTNEQLKCLKSVFSQLNESALTECCLGMNVIIEEAFTQIIYQEDAHYQSDMSIIFYMNVVENMQIGAGRILNMIAQKLAYQQYQHLIAQCMDMSHDNAKLFHHVAEEYLTEAV